MGEDLTYPQRLRGFPRMRPADEDPVEYWNAHTVRVVFDPNPWLTLPRISDHNKTKKRFWKPMKRCNNWEVMCRRCHRSRARDRTVVIKLFLERSLFPIENFVCPNCDRINFTTPFWRL